VAIVDRIGSKRHRVDERADPAPRPRGARTLAELDGLVDKPLEAQPLDQDARQHHPSVGNKAPVVELDRHPVGPHGHPRIHHHTSDLLTQAAAALYSRFLPAQEVIFPSTPDGSDPTTRWIEAKSDLYPDLREQVAALAAVAADVPVHPISGATGAGCGELSRY